MSIINTEIISYKGGDGSSISKAIEIIGAQSFRSGMEAIFDYIINVASFKEIVMIEGEVMYYWDKTFHCVYISTSNGGYEKIFFNSTDFQNKIKPEDADLVKQIFNIYN